MLKQIILIFFYVTTSISFAQVGIGTVTPNANAMLDIESLDSGLLINSLSLSSTTSFAPMNAHVEGIIVYNTSTINDVSPGFYYNNGSTWQRILNSVGGDWFITGNTGTNANTNFIGTTDNQAFSFRTDNRLNHTLETNGTLSVFRPNSVHIGENVGSSGNGNVNVFIGSNTAINNGGGDRSTAVGANTYTSNTNGANNNVIGARAMESNTGRDHSIAIGYKSLENANADRNVAVGNYASRSLVNGARNFSLGVFALNTNVSGNDNTSVGYNSMFSFTSEDFSTAVGANAYFNGSYRNANAIGYNTAVDADNILHLGNTSIVQISGQVNFTTYSDKRIKTNIKEDVVGTEFITQLRPVTYNFDIDKQNEYLKVKESPIYPSKYDIENIEFSGFIAQEIEAAAIKSHYNFNGLSKPEKDQALYMVTYSQFVVPLVKTIKEQQERLKEIKKELQLLKNKK